MEVVSLGEELRKKSALADDRARSIKRFMLEGRILPSEWTMEVLKECVKDALSKCDLVVIDGFPRNESNWRAWKDAAGLEELPVAGVVLLECDQTTMLERIMERGANRPDDNVETVRKRIDGFYNDTMPIVLLMRETLPVVCIDGGRDKEIVHMDVMAWLGRIERK